MRQLLLFSFLLASTYSFGQLVPDFSWTGHCEGESTSFTDLSTSDNTITSWAWKIDHSIPFSTQANPSITFQDTGCLDITLIVTDNSGTDSITQSVCIDPTPVLDCNTNTFSACVGTDYCLPCELKVGNTSVGGTTNWGDGNVGDFNNPCNNYSTCDTYTASFVSVDGCAVAETLTVDAYCPPVPDFDATETGNLGVDFSHESVITGNEIVTGWNWAFGDNTSSVLPNPSHTYPDTGTYNVCMTTTSLHGCMGQICKPVDVSLVVPLFSWTGHCEGRTIQFTDGSTPANDITGWTWYIDGQVFNTQNPTYVFADSGCYDVKLVITSANEIDSITQEVCIDPRGEFVCDNSPLNVCADSPFCIPCRFVIDGDTVDTGTIDWGDGATGNFPNFCHQYSSPGTYPITLITSPFGCTDTASISATIFPVPVAGFTYTQTDLSTVQFTDTSFVPSGGIVAWLWDFGDLNSSTVQNPNHVYSAPGNYQVCLTVIDVNGCSDTYCETIFVSQLVPNFSWDGHCEDENIYFTDESQSLSTISFWLWKVNGIGVSNDTNLVYAFPDSGCYSVSLTVTDDFETKTFTDTVCLDPTPELVCDNTPYTACLGDELCISCHLILNGDTIEEGISWGDGFQGSPNEMCHIYTQCGTYDVTLESSNPCPIDLSIHTFEVTVYDSPVATYSTAQDSLTLSLNNTTTYACETQVPFMGTYKITWGDGLTTIPTSFPRTHTYDSVGTYEVCFWATSPDGCTDSICESIFVSGVSVPEIFEGVNIIIFQQGSNLYVNMDGSNLKAMQFSLYNYSGQLVNATQLNGGNTITFNADAITKGLYVLQIVSEGQSVSRKVMIR